ncbi:MAG: GWxTD domain-containing protein [Bacteroidetes bacterium]|nr:GWxTD domain-containing protein [Bacteroidota bacterium]MBU1719091.1 GWxTD domain-containing protein [Bacteroidota bacterium]
MKYFSGFVLAALILTLQSCFDAKQVSNQNLSYLYNHEERPFTPKYRICHTSPDVTTVFFSLSKNEMLFTRENPSSDFFSNISVFYKLYTSFESSEITDSATVLYQFPKSDKDYLSGKIEIKAPVGANYLLELKIKDESRGKHVKSFFNVIKESMADRQSYMITDTLGNPLYSDYININNPLDLKYFGKIVPALTVRYYHPEFPIAAPPYSTAADRPFRLVADSVFTVELTNNQTRIFLKEEGFYHFMTDTVTKLGLTLFVNNDDFPRFATPEKMLESIRYLSTKNEFDQYNLLKDKKAAVDNFWLECGGSYDRARQLIRKFYSRAEEANIYFSSYIEGWKTDRGMIYMIFGPPNILYKSSDKETWVYGELNNMNSVTYNFIKVKNPLSDNDFNLSRSPIYKLNYFNAVDMWRR